MVEMKMITGAIFTDVRGTLTFFNDFDLTAIKRFYIVQNADEHTVRAWQGHKLETKWFYVMNGSFTVCLIKPDDWINPSHHQKVETYILNSSENKILWIPGGYINGFKANTPESRMMIFSDFSVEDSKADDYRFDKNLWFKWD